MPKKSPRKKPLKSKYEILQQKTTLPENLTDETLLTRKEAAVYARCSSRTVAEWIKKGLPEVKQGKVSRVKKGDLDRFLKRSAKSPDSEPPGNPASKPPAGSTTTSTFQPRFPLPIDPRSEETDKLREKAWMIKETSGLSDEEWAERIRNLK